VEGIFDVRLHDQVRQATFQGCRRSYRDVREYYAEEQREEFRLAPKVEGKNKDGSERARRNKSSAPRNQVFQLQGEGTSRDRVRETANRREQTNGYSIQ